MYDPVAGRWTQRDPIDYQDSVNLYQFCGNNPVNKWDALGKEGTNTQETTLYDELKVADPAYTNMLTVYNKDIDRVQSDLIELNITLLKIPAVCVDPLATVAGAPVKYATDALAKGADQMAEVPVGKVVTAAMDIKGTVNDAVKSVVVTTALQPKAATQSRWENLKQEVKLVLQSVYLMPTDEKK